MGCGSPLADPDEVLVVLYAVQRHAEMLASPDFYTEAHNHGVDQDRALMEIAVAFPEFSDSGAWVSLAANRLRGQIESTVSPEGVHLEHSPAYHLCQMKRLDGIRRFARRTTASRSCRTRE